MALENSPSLKEFEDGLPQDLPDPSQKKKRFRRILFTILTLLLLFAGFTFIQSNTAKLLAGKGSINGLVLDDSGKPFQGYIFILGTDLETQTDENGQFLIEDVPAGMRTLIVANNDAGYEFPTLVEAGKTTNIGQIQFASTAIPEE